MNRPSTDEISAKLLQMNKEELRNLVSQRLLGGNSHSFLPPPSGGMDPEDQADVIIDSFRWLSEKRKIEFSLLREVVSDIANEWSNWSLEDIVKNKKAIFELIWLCGSVGAIDALLPMLRIAIRCDGLELVSSWNRESTTHLVMRVALGLLGPHNEQYWQEYFEMRRRDKIYKDSLVDKPELSKEERAKGGVENEWRTTKIDPQKIADALGGKLEESNDADSKWNIHLYYGRKKPLITLKIDPELRKIHVAVHGPKVGGCPTYRYTDTFYDVEDQWFIESRDPKNGKISTNIYFRVKAGSGMRAGGFIISSDYHRAFGCQRKG